MNDTLHKKRIVEECQIRIYLAVVLDKKMAGIKFKQPKVKKKLPIDLIT